MAGCSRLQNCAIHTVIPDSVPGSLFFALSSRSFFVTPDLYKYKALRLSYENASIFAAFALVAFIPGSPFDEDVVRPLFVERYFYDSAHGIKAVDFLGVL